MQISTKEILAAIKKPISKVSAEGGSKIFLDIFEPDENIGVGSSSDGRTVLLLPGQSNVTSFETNFASFFV